MYKLDLQKIEEDFLGGSVVKNPLANAGDISSVPGLGRLWNFSFRILLRPSLKDFKHNLASM